MTLQAPVSIGFTGIYAGAGKFDSLVLDTANQDVTLARLAAASLRLGAAPSATPIAQTLTLGEASRPGTDTNVAGASGTIRSGLGTGNATGSSLILQTATAVASGSTTQTYATRLTLTSTLNTSASPLLVTNTLYLGTTTSVIISQAGLNILDIVTGGNNGIRITDHVNVTQIGFASTWQGASDITLGRVGAASLRIGAANSASPIANTLTIGESSRSGTDTNVAGASGTLQPGAGTGTGATVPLILNAPIQVASGNGAQTQTEGMRVQAVATAIGIGFYGVAAVARQTVATGSSTDAVITALQNLGLFSQT